MFILRLFHRDNPFEQVEARILAEGELRLGRDPAADWPLVDPDGILSRVHCTLKIDDGALWLRDESTNGTFLDDGARAPAETPVKLVAGQTIRLGALRILVDAPSTDSDGDATLTRIELAPTPRTWTDDDGARVQPRTGSLLEAFCEGARLDPSALSSEDPEELMRRIGAIYQQTVLGLSTLMAQRARVKSDYQLERTTISAARNNPFKWAPTRKLAQDLICNSEPGFLSDAEAVRASFQDLSQHMSAITEGAGSAAKVVLNALAPETIDAEAKSASTLLKSRSSACWDIHNRRHRELATGEEAANPILRSGFKAGYNRALDAAPR